MESCKVIGNKLIINEDVMWHLSKLWPFIVQFECEEMCLRVLKWFEKGHVYYMQQINNWRMNDSNNNNNGVLLPIETELNNANEVIIVTAETTKIEKQIKQMVKQLLLLILQKKGGYHVCDASKLLSLISIRNDDIRSISNSTESMLEIMHNIDNHKYASIFVNGVIHSNFNHNIAVKVWHCVLCQSQKGWENISFQLLLEWIESDPFSVGKFYRLREMEHDAELAQIIMNSNNKDAVTICKIIFKHAYPQCGEKVFFLCLFLLFFGLLAMHNFFFLECNQFAGINKLNNNFKNLEYKNLYFWERALIDLGAKQQSFLRKLKKEDS
ncbi:hypothetical protein RFI_00602 [Reticulomyxa filosa]|uniref:Uncharacterized protein n=1 Tax=Reticulomyxa filosa TaxID=46433 RepID=X6PFK7_RETFI|nr:hypothetical protein RFI_00602 [Reticulomyxa filosa]|eukprot:ETO36457.1 hypothetical protein RFI_00602 [Reticulomyxa filosa]